MGIATINHLKALRYCNNGSRRFFTRYNISWTEFINCGIESEIFRATGDSMAIDLADFADANPELVGSTINKKCSGD